MRKRRSFLVRRRSELTAYGVALIIVVAFGSSLLIMNSKALLDILASSVTSLNGATTTMFFRSYGTTVLTPESTTSIDVNIHTKVPINALGATISFPREAIEIVGISKEKSFFDLWTEETKISENDGEIRFSGGTTKLGGVMGTGTVLTILVRAKVVGKAQLKFENVQVYPSDGSGAQVSTLTKPILYTIEEASTSAGNAALAAPSGGGSIISGSKSTPLPSMDLNEDGKINLVDLSILTIKMLGGYDSRYDFNLNGSVGLDDLSILMSKI